jgi:ribose transport system substrate-binding protein
MNRSIILLTTALLFLTLEVNGNAQSISTAKAHMVIGLSVLDTNNPFFVEMANAMREEAAKRGADVILTSADLNVAKQKGQVSDFIVKRVCAIVLCPADSKAIGPSIAEANQAGIPVFTADIAAIAEADKVVCHVATDNLGGGREAGRAMIQALGGSGKVAILNHPEVESAMMRTKGFQEVLDEHNRSGKGNIEIVADLSGHGSFLVSWALATELLKDHADLNGIFAINDPSALGAVLALEKAGRLSQVKVIGFDAQPKGRQAIKEGKIWGDPVQVPDKIGQQTVQVIFKHLNGEVVPKAILFPTTFYSKADADKDASLK